MMVRWTWAGAPAALVLLLSAGSWAAEPVTLVRSDTGAAVAAADAATTLAASSLAVALEPGATFSVYGFDITAVTATQLLVNASSELLTAAVIDGRAQFNRLGTLEPGEAALRIIATNDLRRVGYDAARLAASLPAPIQASYQPGLARTAASQAKRRWWGWYTPLGLNAQTPVPRNLEALRRQYLLEPAAVDVRQQSAGRLDRQRELVATRFVSAVSAGDVTTVAALLDPTPFVQAGSGWQATRTRYARRLVESPLAASLAGATVAAAEPGQFSVTAAAGSWQLRTAERDNMSFVAALQSGEAP